MNRIFQRQIENDKIFYQNENRGPGAHLDFFGYLFDMLVLVFP